MINDDKKKIYHCTDFYNENTKHSICKNNDLINSLSQKDPLDYHSYIFVSKTGMLQNCQKDKKMEIIKLVSKKKNYNRQMNYNYNYNSKKL